MANFCRVVSIAFIAAIVGLYLGLYAPARRGTPIHFGDGSGEVFEIPTREAMLDRAVSEDFDLAIVGGGATGVAAALEARARGLSVALIEWEDFAAGTSSRSTKLLHGGVRYLRKAFARRDASQYHLVREALRERHFLFSMAPHLSRPLPIVTPLYSWADVPANYALLKFYDWLSFPKLDSSRWYSVARVQQELPAIDTEGLIGGVAYYDGVFDDARMAVSFAMAAAKAGAVVLNHAEVTGVSHNEMGRVSGLEFVDRETGTTHKLSSHGVINAAGHFADHIRKMDNPEAKSILVASSGVHIVLDGKYTSASHSGVLIPKTEDGRVVFIHPWYGHSIVGTTDSPTEVVNNPRPTQEAIDYLLDHAKRALVGLEDAKVLSAWSGIRPLKRADDGSDTASVSREHAVYASPSGMLTIVGGKWTTTRKMAEDVINKAALEYNWDVPAIAEEDPRSTAFAKLAGAAEYNPEWPSTAEALKTGLPTDVLTHLNSVYGDQAHHVAALAVAKPALAERLAPHLPYIAAEVVWSARHEYALDVVDILVRRMSIALVDNAAALEAAPTVARLLAAELGWNAAKTGAAVDAARAYLNVSQD